MVSYLHMNIIHNIFAIFKSICYNLIHLTNNLKNYCIACQNEHEHYSWKMNDEGWYCVGFGTNRKPLKEVNLSDIRLAEDQKHPDLLQPYRENTPSKEFIDHFGPDVAKRWGITDEQIKNSKDVWK